jgi:hypothetical protein
MLHVEGHMAYVLPLTPPFVLAHKAARHRCTAALCSAAIAHVPAGCAVCAIVVASLHGCVSLVLRPPPATVRRSWPRSCRPATPCGPRGACRCGSAVPARPRQGCGTSPGHTCAGTVRACLRGHARRDARGTGHTAAAGGRHRCAADIRRWTSGKVALHIPRDWEKPRWSRHFRPPARLRMHRSPCARE